MTPPLAILLALVCGPLPPAVPQGLAQRADARGAPVADPLGLVPGGINTPGNTTRFVYDGLGRLLAEVHDLRVGGEGTGALDLSEPTNPDGQVTVAYAWDAASRLASVTDDAGRTTAFEYDALDRKVRHVYADGTSASYAWDRDGALRQRTDPNGTVVAYGYDALSRLVRAQVTRAPAPGGGGPGLAVGGTTEETYAYDGLSRLVRATDDQGAGSGPGSSPGTGPGSVVERVYDSLGRVVEERQDGRAVSSAYAGDGKRTGVVYPGGRTIAFEHDALDRVRAIRDATPGGPGLGTGPGGLVAQYAWVGPGLRPLARTHGNGTALSFLAPAGGTGTGTGLGTGYDLVQRVTRLQHLAPGGVPGSPGAAAFVDREYGYDRGSNRVFERRLDDNGLEDRYAHDSTSRLVQAGFDQAGAPGAARRELEGARYRYDGVGNRVEVLRALAPLPGGGGGGGGGGLPAPALRADERVALGPRARVEGDVVAGRAPGAGGSGSGGPGGPGGNSGPSQVVLEPDARVVGSVTAEEVRLQPRARIDGDVRAQQLFVQPQASVGGAILPYAPPASPLPGVPTIAPGAGDVTIRPNQAALLLPGAYRRVVVQARGRLVLQAGTYALERLEVGPQARVEVLGPVVVRTTTRLDLGSRSAVLLAPGLQAPDARFETTDPSPQLGPDATIQAVVVAPAGEVRLQPSTELVGQVYARRVTLQPQVVVRGQGLGGGGPGDPGDPGPGEPREERVAYATNALNQYTQVGGVARVHDRNGNLVDDGQRLLTWDHRNRLVAVHDRASGRPIASYTYDASNRRVTKTTYSAVSPGAVERVTRSLWDGWDLIEEQDAAGQTTATWVCGVGIDEHVAWTRTAAHPLGAGAFYLHQDARGSVVAVTDHAGAVVERTRYDDFGRPDHEGALGQEHGFQGRQRDPETGWVYFRNRFYDPETGRFLSRDPVWDAGNFGNLYAFVGNGPTTGRDPLGFNKWKGVKNVARRLAPEVGGPAPGANAGIAPQHGGSGHDRFLRDYMAGAKSREAIDVRFNQVQASGGDAPHVTGRNRPDYQEIGPDGVRYVLEADTKLESALSHAAEVVLNDPRVRADFVLLDKDGRGVARIHYEPGQAGSLGTWTVDDPGHHFQKSAGPKGSYSFLPFLLAPNAMAAACDPRNSISDLLKLGAYDVAGFLDPIGLIEGVDRAVDAYTERDEDLPAHWKLLDWADRSFMDPFGLKSGGEGAGKLLNWIRRRLQ